MRYQVTYRKRFDEDAGEQVTPAVFLNLPAGVVCDAKLLQEVEPEPNEEDDLFAYGGEVWLYSVTPGREGEFEYAVQNSEFATELVELEDAPETIDLKAAETSGTASIN